MNTFTLSGRVAADPDLRHTRRGQPYVHLRVANSRSFNGRQRISWFRVTCFRDAERIAEDLHQGDKVVLQGSLGTSTTATPDGSNRRYYLNLIVEEVVYFSGNGESDSQPAEAGGSPTGDEDE